MARADLAPVTIAYYSMEIALDDALPAFSGGLGVLAGDHVRAAADRGVPLGAVTLLYAHGFFRQSIVAGAQCESPVDWAPSATLEELPVRIGVVVAGRRVELRVWRHVVCGVDGHRVPVHFLDTDVEENAPEDRRITERLYTSDPFDRLRQEAVLGLGGPLVLDTLGHHGIKVHHLNEGHGALVPVALLARRMAGFDPSGALSHGLVGAGEEDLAAVRARCVFTTHTPVPAGHDRFGPEIAEAVLGRPVLDALGGLGCLEADGSLNMTVLGMRGAAFVNGVSRRHGAVTRTMFPSEHVVSVTNGVHSTTWAAPATAELFDRHLPGWRRDSQELRYASDLPLDDLRAARRRSKHALCAEVRRRTDVALDPAVLTIGIARRFAVYKRNDLVLTDLDRLSAIAENAPIQLVFAGKAHPGDVGAKEMIRHVTSATGARRGRVTVAFVENYGMALGRVLCAGSDVWLNTPVPPNEASGTSGMKAALNGVPSLSTLDGWWLEGCVDGVTGWAIGAPTDERAPTDEGAEDADRLYRALEGVVVPMYYKDPDALLAIGRNAIALNASFFSAHRMVDEYARRAYRPALET
ncbi:MAG TPA: alpha-glucan family phosphorylase [Acidimicrobiales bacterium]|nr:alpha-glucan family phosphorylase [Acidimicrobiales bacterium]